MEFLSAAPVRARIERMLADWARRIWHTPLSASPVKPMVPVLRLGSRLYARGLARDQRQARSHQCRLPAYVISVGNLVVGGTGKTPFTLWLARHLSSKGIITAILSRGYRRESNDVTRVPRDGETAPQVRRVGDEPVLLARRLPGVPVWVGRERGASGREAIRTSRAQVLLLDDGFQHLALHRDLDFVLLDSRNPFGNGCLLPLGPLREPAGHLERAHALVLTRSESGAATTETVSMLEKRFAGKPVFVCRHRLTGIKLGMDGPEIPLEILRRSRSLAFTGIAHPGAFFESLEVLGISLCRCLGFPDHYRYSPVDILQFFSILRKCGARFLITTEKDLVRLPAAIQPGVLTANLELDFGHRSGGVRSFVDEKLTAAGFVL